MPLLKKATILFDLVHNELLNISESEYSEFLTLLERLNVKIKLNEEKDISKKLLNCDILIIGNPIDNYFSNMEIKDIISFVRNGGGLLLISEYGADHIQKTNLNDISKNFGIYFEKNITKESNPNHSNCESILSIHNIQDHRITNQVREILLGGTCSLIIDKNARSLFKSSQNSWTETYNDNNNKWTKQEVNIIKNLGAFTKFGRGKVVTLGDIDIFSNENLNKLDNRQFIINLLNWLIEPIKDSDVVTDILNQIGILNNEIRGLDNKVINIIETMTFLEHRITKLELHKLQAKNPDFGHKKVENKPLEKSQRPSFL